MSEYPQGLLGRSAAEAAEAIAGALLDDARAARRRLRGAKDPEALHDFRVALRRLRTLFRALRPGLGRAVPRRLRRRMRELARATNPARDVEVQTAWIRERYRTLKRGQQTGARWLLRELDAAVESAYTGSKTAIDDAYPSLERRIRRGLSEAVATGAGGAAASFGGAMARHVREAMTALEHQMEILATEHDAAPVHAARIAAKRLRYLVELLEPDVERAPEAVKLLKQLQTLLGDWHDAQLLDDRLAVACERAAAEHARRLRELPPGDRKARERARRRNATPGMLVLTRRTREAQAGFLQEFTTTWRNGSWAALAEAVAATLAAVDARAGATVEIERKYLLKRLPDRVNDAPAMEVEQGFLPGTKLVERLRHVRQDGKDEYFRTVKVGAGVARVELEEEAAPELFSHLWPLTEGRRVRKRRYRIAEGDLVWEIDQFLDRKLVLAEVELPSPEAAPALPEWLAPVVIREVTGNPRYVNANLAK